MFLMSWHVLSARLFIIFLFSNIININIYLLRKKKLKLKNKSICGKLGKGLGNLLKVNGSTTYFNLQAIVWAATCSPLFFLTQNCGGVGGQVYHHISV